MTVFAAVDVGASGGRVMRGVVDDDGVALDAVHRFANGVIERGGHLRWDIQRIHHEVLEGLARIPDATSIGIDTWGVDYGLVADTGELFADPISYRDERTAKAVDAVHRVISPEALYHITGTQQLRFNTIYQLAVETRLAEAQHAVLVPDLLAYFLTGELRTELTNASTTGLVDTQTQQWSTTLFDLIGLRHDLFPEIERPGEQRGGYRGTPVITVGSHDTASAVAGVPSDRETFAYIASGTWSLVGIVVDAPVITEEARAANFTNEIAVDGRIRFLRNVGGLWLIQECLREWQRDLEPVLQEAAALPTSDVRIDVEDSAFIAPGDMPNRVAVAAGRAMGEAETVRCILQSLADGYARAITEVAKISGRAIDVVHIVGGGSRNRLLCQLVADSTGQPVVAGPVEATALGNVLVQARAHGLTPQPSPTLRTYEPR